MSMVEVDLHMQLRAFKRGVNEFVAELHGSSISKKDREKIMTYLRTNILNPTNHTVPEIYFLGEPHA